MTSDIYHDWPQYQYRATLVRVKDGDTAILTVQLGFNVNAEVTVRIIGYNAPEIHGPNPRAARDAQIALGEILSGMTLFIRTKKDSMSFERYLAQVYVWNDGNFSDVADIMKEKGYHVPQGD